MALDPTSRESNIKDSIKKYFVDNIYKTEKTPLSFDITIPSPKVQGVQAKKWVTIDMGYLNMNYVSEQSLRVYCSTREDPEGYKLAQLRDTVYNYLVDNTKTDGVARIPFYRSRETGAWTLIGTFMVFVDNESTHLRASDESKFKYFDIRLKFASK